MTSIEELNPSLKGIGKYEFGWSDSDEAGSIAKRGLSEDVVRNISALKSEPEWMLKMRLRGRQVGVERRHGGVVALDEGDAAPRERHDGLLALRLGHEPHGLDGEVVVLLVEAVAAGLGQREHLGGATATAGAVDLLVARLHDGLADEVVEVTAHGGWGEVEQSREVRRGRGAVLQDRARHAVTRGSVPLGGRSRPGEFHNDSVTLLRGPVQARVA